MYKWDKPRFINMSDTQLNVAKIQTSYMLLPSKRVKTKNIVIERQHRYLLMDDRKSIDIKFSVHLILLRHHHQIISLDWIKSVNSHITAPEIYCLWKKRLVLACWPVSSSLFIIYWWCLCFCTHINKKEMWQGKERNILRLAW